MLEKIIAWWDSTHIHEQIADVDAVALFTNPWFLVPFILILGYMIYKQSWKEIVIFTLLGGVWWVSGTNYMDTLIIGNELQMNKVLQVVFGGAVVLGLIIYLLFGRSD